MGAQNETKMIKTLKKDCMLQPSKLIHVPPPLPAFADAVAGTVSGTAVGIAIATAVGTVAWYCKCRRRWHRIGIVAGKDRDPMWDFFSIFTSRTMSECWCHLFHLDFHSIPLTGMVSLDGFAWTLISAKRVQFLWHWTILFEQKFNKSNLYNMSASAAHGCNKFTQYQTVDVELLSNVMTWVMIARVKTSRGHPLWQLWQPLDLVTKKVRCSLSSVSKNKVQIFYSDCYSRIESLNYS